jgi:hypothetical protein
MLWPPFGRDLFQSFPNGNLRWSLDRFHVFLSAPAGRGRGAPVLKHCELARHGESGLSGGPRAARTPQLLSDEKQKRLILARTMYATLYSKGRSIEPPHFYGSVRSTA